MRLFPDFYLKCRVQQGKKNLGNIWFEQKVPLNQGWNLVHLSQNKIPWLSLTLDKKKYFIPQLKKKKNSLMLGTLSTGVGTISSFCQLFF